MFLLAKYSLSSSCVYGLFKIKDKKSITDGDIITVKKVVKYYPNAEKFFKEIFDVDEEYWACFVPILDMDGTARMVYTSEDEIIRVDTTEEALLYIELNNLINYKL